MSKVTLVFSLIGLITTYHGWGGLEMVVNCIMKVLWRHSLFGHLQCVPKWSHLSKMSKMTSNLSFIGLRTHNLVGVGWKGSSTASWRYIEGIAFWASSICARLVSPVSYGQLDIKVVFDRSQNHITWLWWAGKSCQLHHEGSLKAWFLGTYNLCPTGLTCL